MDGYIQIKEAAKKREIGERRINELCLNGRIKGAVKFGNTWAIPADSEKPADARIKSGILSIILIIPAISVLPEKR